MAQNNAIKTGIEFDKDIDHPDAEVYGYADDGEYSVVWAVWEDEAAERYGVSVYNCESGLYERIARDDRELHEFSSVEHAAYALAEDDPETSVQEARDHFQGRN